MLAVSQLLTDPELVTRSEQERGRLRELLFERVGVFNRLAREAGLQYPRYEGGFFVAVFTPDPQKTQDSMQREGVFVVPLSGAVRVAICATPASKVPRLVEALARGLEAAR